MKWYKLKYSGKNNKNNRKRGIGTNVEFKDTVVLRLIKYSAVMASYLVPTTSLSKQNNSLFTIS